MSATDSSANGKPWPKHVISNVTQPPVSILTPTYNRRKFIPMLINCIKSQTYPKDHMEWVVLDDGTDSVFDLIEPHMKSMNINYIRSEEKLNVGVKRNRLHDAARGTILVNMDDDDYYMPERVSHAVQTLVRNKAAICGATCNHLYFNDDHSVWSCGPYNPNHATFGTMAYTKAYTKTHRCDETVTFAEEIEFTKKYSEPLKQLDPMKVMLVICHKENTIDKGKLRTPTNIHFRKTSLKLKNFVKSAELRTFYENV